MVKNTGGNKGKKVARKTVGSQQSNTKEVRRVSDPCEMYAVITKIYSSKRCDIIGTDGKTRICNIRGKFLGRKRNGDGVIAVGTWIMVGFYDWEVRGDGSKSCDLLEVYTHNEKEKLKQIENGGLLSAIIGIGELAGSENEFTFSEFHINEEEQVPEQPLPVDDDMPPIDDDDDDMPPHNALAQKNKLPPKNKPPAKLSLAAHMQKINMAKKETPNEQMDWLNINVMDI